MVPAECCLDLHFKAMLNRMGGAALTTPRPPPGQVGGSRALRGSLTPRQVTEPKSSMKTESNFEVGKSQF